MSPSEREPGRRPRRIFYDPEERSLPGRASRLAVIVNDLLGDRYEGWLGEVYVGYDHGNRTGRAWALHMKARCFLMEMYGINAPSFWLTLRDFARWGREVCR